MTVGYQQHPLWGPQLVEDDYGSGGKGRSEASRGDQCKTRQGLECHINETEVHFEENGEPWEDLECRRNMVKLGGAVQSSPAKYLLDSSRLISSNLSVPYFPLC